MKTLKTHTVALYAGIIALVVGLAAFTLSWNLWDTWGGPMPGVQILLFPGNLTLVWVWHPLFTEEINFWPKLAMLMLGQFSVVASVVALLTGILRKIKADEKH
ncbi:hypothetical protein CWE12_07100 [Aliidiomarina sedimenti]|uniref:Uncharacterized protein n=1 Tax=Aliidiomarina sedimenti TaxID=1933879 RepID=A0ABY0BYH8_9GAMM|nr:hypothetical protein [Aliidiomarina sedimenti]RUO29731.1 hypothetical protein CWE12_07100 [Aliidiomarina sedimenti]